MSVIDWLWEHSILILLGILLIWIFVIIVNSLWANSVGTWRRGQLRASCPPEVARLAEYASSYTCGLRIAQDLGRLASDDGLERVSPAKIILTDLVKILGHLADDSAGLSWKQVELIHAFGAASFDSEIATMPEYLIVNFAKTSTSEDSGDAQVLRLLAAMEHPDRHSLRDMYIDFANIAAEGDSERLAELIKEIRDASRTKRELVNDHIEGMKSQIANLEEELHEGYREVLGITADSSNSEIKAAYHRQVVLWHPDRLEGMAPELHAAATERLKEINEAYEWASGSFEVRN
ncbi:J domain-containing protein [Granulicella aggregans]|uniref:J domain-containing protein n=1 Tax=Granulicella aggregans TaxID=474949 RepID=UPI0021E0786C|nr:J domain-containing protein [Granulicella aggregans]